ncbi:MAG: Rieske (2Fe-2S) protein [Anaerolineales bacterium]|jgi:menaquinol-cytochrome c reductase iron-sulfur subunit
MKMTDQPQGGPTPAIEVSRRNFLQLISIAMALVGGALVGIPIIGFLFSPLFKKTEQVWRPVGNVENFKVGTTTNVIFTDSSPLPWAGVSARSAAWLRRVDETNFEAFSVNCTHLGCPVNWVQTADLFLCPCHGGVYNNEGQVVAGPPPLPLTKYPVRVQAGQVQILTSPIPIT